MTRFLPLLLPFSSAAVAPQKTLHALLLIADDYEDAEDNAIAQSVRVDFANVTNFLGLEGEDVFPFVFSTKEGGKTIRYAFALIAQDEDTLVLVLLEEDGPRARAFDEVTVLRRK